MSREEPQGRSGSLVPRAHLSLLRQIGRLGAENAARSLSFLLGRKGELKISQVLPLHFNEITEYLGGAEERVVTVFARFEGNISGNMLYVLHEEDARGIIAALSDEGGEGEFSEMELSLMQEVGNILIGSYITALSDFLALELKSSVPALAVDESLQGVFPDVPLGMVLLGLIHRIHGRQLRPVLPDEPGMVKEP